MHADSIPRIIHLISPGKEPPVKYSDTVARMRQLHPAWEIKIWDDATVSSTVALFFPDWMDAFTGYALPVQKTDIFRVMAVYLYGGFYLDMDINCLAELDGLCIHGMVLGIEKILSPQQCDRLGHVYPVRIANYMFGSKPGHAFWLDFLREAKTRSGVKIRRESEVLESTGPGLLTAVYHTNAYRYTDITLLANPDKACPGSCGPASCHFGEYAAHLHFGSWRWETA